jgi:alkaline phosphatase
MYRHVILALLFQSSVLVAQDADSAAVKHLIIFIGDGCGIKQHEAANSYTGIVPDYQSWSAYWVATGYSGLGYDTSAAWNDFNYVRQDATDSAAGATAPFTGVKTANGKISVTANDVRLFSLGDKARAIGRALGSVSSVYLSHNTPGAWMAHNTYRGNGYAVADEALFGHPNTTGGRRENKYTGGKGPSRPPVDVVLGAGHPNWASNSYVNSKIRDKLIAESGLVDKHLFVERIAGSLDGGARLMTAANDTNVTMLAGMFGGHNLPYRLADGSAYNPENPTLAEMTRAALTVLSRRRAGFALMVEGGAIDWVAHDGYMSKMIGEIIDFNSAIDTAITWVEDSTNGSSWDNTLIVITADHETGYLTAGHRVFTDQPLGLINDSTIALEKDIFATQIRASWDDSDSNSVLDPGESMNWMWNTTGHTNSLVPLWAKGPGAARFAHGVVGTDPVRGDYIENTELFKVADYVFGGPNHAPTINALEDATISEDSTLTVEVSGTDPDDNPLGFRAVGNPNVIHSSHVDSLLLVTADQDWFGVAEVFAIASDGRLTDSTSFTLTVTPVNDPPAWIGLPDTIWLKPGENDTLLLADYVTDVDDPDSNLVWDDLVCVGTDGTCVFSHGDTAFISAGSLTEEVPVRFIVTDTSATSDTAWTVIFSTPTAAVAGGELTPAVFRLAQNYPNPFNPITTIRFELPLASPVYLGVYDLLGREVTRLVQGTQLPGFYESYWDGRDQNGRSVPSGIYIARLLVPPTAGATSGYSKSIKMLLLK